MMKKRITVLALLLGLTVCFCACGNSGAVKNDTPEVTDQAAQNQSETSETVPYDHFTVIFDKNTTPDDLTDDESFTYYTSGWGAVQKSSVVEIPYAEDAVIPASEAPKPSRKGFYFAGWQTVPVVTEADLVNGVSKYQVYFDEKLSTLGAAKVSAADSKEVETRMLNNEAMYLKDFEGLTEDGTLTLYARWVEAKEVSTEEDLKNMANDLYGAYVLTNDITLTEPWKPIGAYFSNYEYFNDSWWTYAFRGTLDGNGYTIYGLEVNGAEIENTMDMASSETIWHNDGLTANGTAAMFGAICYANISNLTIDGAKIHVSGEYAYSGDYCYAAALACFDMASSMKEVHIKNSEVWMEYDDSSMQYAADMFVAAAGLEAGGWSSTVSDCSVENTTISLSAETVKSHGGELYMGGMIGECYATMKNNVVDVKMVLNEQDLCESSNDRELLMNIGGISAANTSSSGNTVTADMNLTVSKPVGNTLLNVGGYAGSQRYMTATDNTIKGTINTNFTLDPDSSVVNAGSVLGRIDAYYATLILMYADGVTCGASGNMAEVSWNGALMAEQMPASGMPQVNGEPISYVATKDYTDAEGNTYKANVDDVVTAYGSYIPKDAMMANNIMYIKVE